MFFNGMYFIKDFCPTICLFFSFMSTGLISKFKHFGLTQCSHQLEVEAVSLYSVVQLHVYLFHNPYYRQVLYLYATKSAEHHMVSNNVLIFHFGDSFHLNYLTADQPTGLWFDRLSYTICSLLPCFNE